ncbi:S1/P1 nuclease [Galbibacter sp. EGI 63066]|uniref:S1/P1 nuclease n=1 Tax=Galbibacter sp. EGI 63066 TaxID=2993559 RepID=UPI00224922A6|nr:S1/P1 nuclease [Galbibacter sp. EGI 63066]MCX2680490.1 S1/P1 nuclease [Galbibacter sp. EGI 63066]
MRFLLIICLLCVQQTIANTPFWGKTGHRVVGEVAEQHLNRRTQRKIAKLLDGQSLALVANYADDIKSDDRFKEFGPWHYVNFPFGKKYGEETPSEYGDIVVAIEKCIAIIKDKEASKADRAFYLKLLVHFMGDLHQPMHVGRAEDKGGNDIQVRWFNKGTNLHRLWDSDMIDFYGMSYTELATNLPVYSKAQKKAIVSGDLLDWVDETRQITKKVYASVEIGEKLGYRYMYDHFDLVRSQLEKGGLRLAEILNELF